MKTKATETPRPATRSLDLLYWISRAPSFSMPHGINAYAIADDVMAKAREIVGNHKPALKR